LKNIEYPMNDQRKTKISKFLSLVLRHKPDEIGIQLDEAGWVDVPVLLEAMARHGTTISREDLAEVVATSEKKRFIFSEEGSRIRANQGHSVTVDLGLQPATPPEILFHGTATRFIDSIRKGGLQKMQRQHVHLCADIDTASDVGERHGKLAMLHIRAGDMQRDGLKFFRSANGVWLTDEVPPQYIQFPQAIERG
jgi:putative RNA 2'-phosphotransferase